MSMSAKGKRPCPCAHGTGTPFKGQGPLVRHRGARLEHWGFPMGHQWSAHC